MRAGRLQDVVGPAQLLDLAFQFLDALRLRSGGADTQTAVDLGLLDTFVEGLRHAANLGSYRLNGCLQRGIVGSVLLHHANSAFANFRGELV